MMMITIIDLGIGNIGSLKNILRVLGEESYVTHNPEKVGSATKIILPGVGHFDQAMKSLHSTGLVEVLKDRVSDGIPLLGICLGMQILMEGSEEGELDGLGLIPGRLVKFKNEQHKVPHMGWDYVDYKILPITKYFGEHITRFYFVHSYFATVEPEYELMSTSYDDILFSSGIHKDNIYGVQFHPEKSHKHGKALLKGFVEL